MEIVSQSASMQATAHAWRTAGETIAFVPTMGALHRGHEALLNAARQRGTKRILSIFVNPLQFGPAEDFATYPRTPRADEDLARACGVDALFLPTAEEIYPEGNTTIVDVTGLTEGLCGASRPGHFRGVTTVVSTLLHITQPQIALFGEKDFQQLQVIRRMVVDLRMPVEVVAIPTVREEDGLAMSSRNRGLTHNERQQAAHIPQALAAAKEMAQSGSTPVAIQSAIAQQFMEAGISRVDYITVVDSISLQPIDRLTRAARFCIAVYVGSTRLIDNIAL